MKSDKPQMSSGKTRINATKKKGESWTKIRDAKKSSRKKDEQDASNDAFLESVTKE